MIVDAVLDAVRRGAAAPGAFSHAVHIEAAWQLLEQGDFGAAVTRMSRTLREITTALGRPEKYHETITVAFVALIAERRAAFGGAHSFEDFRARNADLFERNVLARYYDKATLESDLARRAFVLPRASV